MTDSGIPPRAPKRRLFYDSNWGWIWSGIMVALLVLRHWIVSDESTREFLGWLAEPWLLLLVAFAAFVAWAVRHQRTLRRFNADCFVGLELLARGELDQAHDLFERLQRDWPRPREVRLVILHNLGWTRLRQGRLRAAVEAFAKLDAQRRRKEKGGLWSMSAGKMACAHALLGELDAAKSWLEELGRRTLPGDSRDRSSPGMVVLAQAILECRSQRGSDIVRTLDSSWISLESQYTGEIIRPLRAVRAFAVHAAGGESAASTVQSLLAPLREGPPDELAFLGAGWPEMRGFLAEQRIAGTLAT